MQRLDETRMVPGTRRVHLVPEQVDLLKRTIAKGADDDELDLFLAVCNRTGLDPFIGQIYAVKRKGEMSIQVGIDGLRLIAERAGTYAPGNSPTYTLKDDGTLDSCTAYAHKARRTPDGKFAWFKVDATVWYDEKVQKTREGKPNRFWRDSPRNQLAKCAEALLIRKCCPQDTAGLAVDFEVAESEVGRVTVTHPDSQQQLMGLSAEMDVDVETGELQEVAGAFPGDPWDDARAEVAELIGRVQDKPLATNPVTAARRGAFVGALEEVFGEGHYLAICSALVAVNRGGKLESTKELSGAAIWAIGTWLGREKDPETEEWYWADEERLDLARSILAEFQRHHGQLEMDLTPDEILERFPTDTEEVN